MVNAENRIVESLEAANVRRLVGHYAKARQGLDDLAREQSKQTPINPQLLANMVSDLASDVAIFIV
jgi:pyruvate dehydrogenase (quinone)